MSSSLGAMTESCRALRDLLLVVAFPNCRIAMAVMKLPTSTPFFLRIEAILNKAKERALLDLITELGNVA